MTCPQCGGALATYALGGREASVCEDCGYVGIAAEHRGDPRSIESWDDALRRFYRAHGSEGAPSIDLHPPLSRPSSGSTGEDESWDDALRRFYARRMRDSEADDGSDENVDTVDEDAASDTADEDAASDTADEDAASDTADEDAASDALNTSDSVADGVEADAGGSHSPG